MYKDSQFDIPEVRLVYNQSDNYEIYENVSDSKTCVIYFSSHGIYYPNDSKTFRTRIIEGNRFDWKRNVLRSACKIIFLRDVLKVWYLAGINAEINSVEKIVSFLKKETRGLDVICVGSSAGGYAATLFGMLLKARSIFSFSGQFSLLPYAEAADTDLTSSIAEKCKTDPGIGQYCSLRDMLVSSETPVFYFYASQADIDTVQAEIVADVAGVYCFSFLSKTHSKTCYPINFLDLFSKAPNDLVLLSERFSKRSISALFFSFYVSGCKKTLGYAVDKLCSLLAHIIKAKFVVKPLGGQSGVYSLKQIERL